MINDKNYHEYRFSGFSARVGINEILPLWSRNRTKSDTVVYEQVRWNGGFKNWS